MYANAITRFFIDDVNTIGMHQHVNNLSIQEDVAASGRLVIEEENEIYFRMKKN